MFSEFSKTFEDMAARWWDGTLRDPATLERMGSFLNDACAAKERSDRALEDHWNRWRMPSAADIERVVERLGDLDERLARIEARLSQQETPGARSDS